MRSRLDGVSRKKKTDELCSVCGCIIETTVEDEAQSGVGGGGAMKETERR